MEATSLVEETRPDDKDQEAATQAAAVSFWRATWWRLRKDYGYAQILWDGIKDMREYDELSWNPEITSMRLIMWWQRYVTAPDCMMPNRCPRGHGEHCSLKGLIAVTQYGLPGWLLVANEMRKCRRDFDPGGCC